MTSGEPVMMIDALKYVLSREPDTNWGFESLNPKGDNCRMILNRGGKAHYFFDRNEVSVTASKGDVVFVAYDEVYHPHSDKDDPWAFTVIEFTIRTDAETRERIMRLPKLLHHQNNPKIERMFEELQREWIMRRYGWSAKCRGILYEIMCENFRCGMENPHVPHAAKLRGLMEEMNKNPAHTFTSEEMSAITELSPDTLRRHFRQLTGTTPVQYLNRLRINKARELLLSSGCNVSEAACRVGFSDIYYFSRLFKKLDGHSPSFYISLSSL